MEGEIEREVFISVKEEPLIILSDDDENLGSWLQVATPMREEGPAPFVKKTFEMVDDVETDSIVSWSSTRAGASFIVWDPHKLCTHLLPKYFKHNNFSSFVRQLNTYRFRKIDPDRWEFGNEGFQKGKKNLLKHVKRRKQSSQKGASELAKLRDDHTALTTQLSSLRHQQHDALGRLASLQERLHVAETKQKHVLLFFIKTLNNPMLKKRSLDEPGFDVLLENFVLWEKLMEDDMIYADDQEQAIKSQLEDLIANPPN